MADKKGNNVGRTIVKIYQNVNALTFSKNNLKTVKILPILSLPLILNSGRLSLFIELIVSRILLQGNEQIIFVPCV